MPATALYYDAMHVGSLLQMRVSLMIQGDGAGNFRWGEWAWVSAASLFS